MTPGTADAVRRRSLRALYRRTAAGSGFSTVSPPSQREFDCKSVQTAVPDSTSTSSSFTGFGHCSEDAINQYVATKTARCPVYWGNYLLHTIMWRVVVLFTAFAAAAAAPVKLIIDTDAGFDGGLTIGAVHGLCGL